MKIIKKIISLILILSMISNLLGCDVVQSRVDEYTRIDFTAFDTVGYITIFQVEDYESYQKNEEHFNQNIKMILSQLEKIFSRTDEQSELYALNHRETNEVMVSRPLSNLLAVAKDMYEWSVHNFDISVGNLVELWDVKNNTEPPTQEKINEALKFANNMDYEIIQDFDSDNILSDKIIFKNDLKTHYDLGALAKGYAAMNLKELLTDTMGVTSALINFGGSVTVVGSKDEVPFNIGIKRPFKEGYITTEKVINRSLITSGTYERYFEYNGRIYSHVINNNTGYPIDNELTSVTINCDNPIMGDFLSTAILLVGIENGKYLLQALKNKFEDEDMYAVVIDKNENITRFE